MCVFTNVWNDDNFDIKTQIMVLNKNPDVNESLNLKGNHLEREEIN